MICSWFIHLNTAKFVQHAVLSIDPTGIQASAEAGAAGSNPVINKLAEFRDAFWRFLRPHTIRGTALGSWCVVTVLMEQLC